MAYAVHRHVICENLSLEQREAKMSAEDRSIEQKTQLLLDEAEALIWGLLDENIDAVNSQRLEELMANEEVRKRYIQCVELHTDLQNLYEGTSTKPQSPVLGSLGDVFPNLSNTNVVPPLGE